MSQCATRWCSPYSGASAPSSSPATTVAARRCPPRSRRRARRRRAGSGAPAAGGAPRRPTVSASAVGTPLLVAERAALELELLGTGGVAVLARLGDLARQRLDLCAELLGALEAQPVLGVELERARRRLGRRCRAAPSAARTALGVPSEQAEIDHAAMVRGGDGQLTAAPLCAHRLRSWRDAAIERGRALRSLRRARRPPTTSTSVSSGARWSHSSGPTARARPRAWRRSSATDGRRPDVRRVLGLDPVADHVGLVPRLGAMLQQGGVWPSMRAARGAPARSRATTTTPRTPTGCSSGSTSRRCASRTWRRLSGGEQQRLSLAIALLPRPEALFLDEPTAGVDPVGRRVIRDVIADARHRGVAVLLMTHDLADVEAAATGGRAARGPGPRGRVGGRAHQGRHHVRRLGPGSTSASVTAAVGATVDEGPPGTYRDRTDARRGRDRRARHRARSPRRPARRAAARRARSRSATSRSSVRRRRAGRRRADAAAAA